MIRFLLVLFLMLLPTTALADELRPGYLALDQQSPTDWLMVWKAPIKGGLAANGVIRLPSSCHFTQNVRESDGLALRVMGKLRCAGTLAGTALRIDGMDAQTNDVIVRVKMLDHPYQTGRISAATPEFSITERPDPMEVAQTYVWLGIEHILLGFDHLLFVIALVLLIRRGWMIAKTVTAFTFAHSLTLIGTTLGFFGLPMRPVESVIALSILFLAVELAKRDPAVPRLSERFPWLVALLFGLLHGFGFAGALGEIGLPEGDVPLALLCFNIGVELGQLGVVALLLAILALLRRAPAIISSVFEKAVAYGIGIMSCYWLLQRSFS